MAPGDCRIGKIGESYQPGLLPYGGRTDSRGKITYVVNKEEYQSKIKRLRSDE